VSNDNLEEEKRRMELEEAWRSVVDKASQLSSLGSQITHEAAKLSDAADLGIRAAQYGSPYADWETGIAYASGLNSSLDHMLDVGRVIAKEFPAVNTSGSAAVYASSALVSTAYLVNLPAPQQTAAFEVQQGYAQFFERTKVKTHVLDLLNERNFQGAAEGETVIQKFRNAWEMYESMPVLPDPALASLISLRESIEIVISELVRRRPVQWKAKDKILGIGEQVAFDSVPANVFDDLQQDYGRLTNRLAGAKRNVLDRVAETELMREGTYFLERLLSAVDPGKLR
jgi:hypothetical protein